MRVQQWKADSIRGARCLRYCPACSDLSHLSYAGKSTRSHSRTLPISTLPHTHFPTVPLSHFRDPRTLTRSHSCTRALTHSRTLPSTRSRILPYSAPRSAEYVTHRPCFAYGFQQPPKQQLTMSPSHLVTSTARAGTPRLHSGCYIRGQVWRAGIEGRVERAGYGGQGVCGQPKRSAPIKFKRIQRGPTALPTTSSARTNA